MTEWPALVGVALGGRMCLCRELSPPPLRATKYVHALRLPGQRPPRAASPVQTWSSAANFRNDLSTQLLLSHWCRGGCGRSSQGRGCERRCAEGSCGHFSSVPARPAWWDLCAVTRGGPSDGSGSCALGPGWRRYRRAGFYDRHRVSGWA